MNGVLEVLGLLHEQLALQSNETWVKKGKKRKRGVRPSKVNNSRGCESRPGKVGQPPGSKHWAGGGDSKCYVQQLQIGENYETREPFAKLSGIRSQ